MRKLWHRILSWIYGSWLGINLDSVIQIQKEQIDTFKFELKELMKQLVITIHEQEETVGQLVITLEDMNEEIEKMKNVIQERLPVNWDTIFPRGPKAFTHTDRQ